MKLWNVFYWKRLQPKIDWYLFVYLCKAGLHDKIV